MGDFFKLFCSIALMTIQSCNITNNKSGEIYNYAIPPIFRDSFTIKYINNCSFDYTEDSIDVENYLLQLEHYKLFCLDRNNFDAYEDSLFNSKFFYTKHSTSKEYALASSFYLYNYNSCLSEEIGLRTAIIFAIMPEKVQVLDTYSSYLDKQRRDSLWNNVFDYIRGAIENYNTTVISEREELDIIQQYYPFLYSIISCSLKDK